MNKEIISILSKKAAIPYKVENIKLKPAIEENNPIDNIAIKGRNPSHFKILYFVVNFFKN